MAADSSTRDDSKLEQDAVIAKKVKLLFENWREVVLSSYDILLWRNYPLHAGCIFAASSLIFLLFHALDLSIVSTISLLMLVFITLDYLGPIVISKIYQQEQWNGSKEKQFVKICSNIAHYYILITSQISAYIEMRSTKPQMFYMVSIPLCLLLAWIGNSINNIFLTYIVVTFLLLLPGLNHNGIMDKGIKLGKQYLAKGLNMVLKNKQKTR